MLTKVKIGYREKLLVRIRLNYMASLSKCLLY
jgi:hypothetical protein